MSNIQQKEGIVTGLATFCVGTAFGNTLVNERQKKDRSYGKTRKKK
jgi:hypothetical protein